MTVASSQPSVASIPASITSVLLTGVNSNRDGLTIQNMSATATLFLSYQNPATADNAWLELPPKGLYSFDKNLVPTNAIYGIWTAASGRAAVTEYS